MKIKQSCFSTSVILIMFMAINNKKLFLFFLFIASGIVLFNFILPYMGNEGHQTKKSTYDVIIVLGSPATDNCSPSPIMLQRVNKGLELLNKGIAPKIIFTGNSVANDCVEAEVMAKYALSKGICDSIIYVEPQAMNTYQNAFYSVEIMNNHNFKSAAIVTSEFHIKRASAIFSNYDIEYQLFECRNPRMGIDYFYAKVRENFILSCHTLIGYPPDFGMWR